MMKRIALFGGTFDPPHLGHVSVVDAVLSHLDIDGIVIMPAFCNPFKDNVVAPANLRLKWLQKMFEAYPNVVIDDFEIRSERKVPTIETVLYLLQTYETIYLVIGADNVKSLAKWHRYTELCKLVTFVVATRDAITVPNKYITLPVNKPVSATSLRHHIDKNLLSPKVADAIEQFYKEKYWTKE
jgi:nicotinate-nucleotide adenylyltransferase